MTAPERTESPTEGTAGLLAAHAVIGFSPMACVCSCDRAWRPHDEYRAHLAAVLDAHVTERCAETLEKAADGIGDSTWTTPNERWRFSTWLRDRAAAGRGGTK